METAQQLSSQDQDQRLFSLLSSSEIELVPYVEMEDGWSLPDEFLMSVAIKAQQACVLNKVFYDGSVMSPQDFVEAMQTKTNYPVFGFHSGEVIGWAWLNGVSDTHAMAHFCTLQAAWGKLAYKAAEVCICYWFTAMPDLQVLTGFTPSNNVNAVRFIEKVGFKRAGEIPRMLRDVYSNEIVSAVISYYERD